MKNIPRQRSFLAALFAAALLALAFCASPAFAWPLVPIINHDSIPVTTGSGRLPQAEQVRQAIQQAATGRGWSLVQHTDGTLLATLNVRNKHQIVVEIGYSAERYSLKYRDSVNMQYEVLGGEPSIHSKYNKWVQNLASAIRVELLKF